MSERIVAATEDTTVNNADCDCCVPGVVVVCKAYFYVYLLLILVTIGVLLHYSYVRRRSRRPALLLKDTSKFWIVVIVMSLQVCRTLYFSTAYLQLDNDVPAGI